MGESARLRDIASGRRDALNVDPRLIRIDAGFNPRQYTIFENRQHLDDLKRSISQVGVLVPLLVRWDGEQAVVIDGECRLRACLELIKEGVPLKTVPVLQETTKDEAQRLLLAIAANKGKPFSMLESGGAYKRLQAFGLSVEDIAAKVGVSHRAVTDALELFEAPREVKEMVSKGEVTPSLAKQVVRAKGDGAGKALREKVEQAKSKGKKTATREKAEPKERKAEKSQVDQERQLGDQMAEMILGDTELTDTPLGRLAKKWNKLRGL